MIGVRLETRDLWHRYGDRVVLRGLDLNVAPGEFLAVIGRSGTGKTTLLRLMAGLEEVQQGRLEQNSAPIRGINRCARLMFQDGRLLPWDRVAGNVGLGLPRERADRVAWALERVGLADRADDWPAKLSGGQRQRVALARALAAGPGLLLLDEPLGALDALTRIEMQSLVESAWLEAGSTAVLVTHDVEEAIILADRVIVLDQGQISMERSVTLPRPRHRAAQQFAGMVREFLDHLLGATHTTPIPCVTPTMAYPSAELRGTP